MNLVNTFVEVKINNDEDFLKIRETLTRIGVASKKDKKLYQSCHILHKQGRYYITHFKELFALDGKPTDFTEEDKARRNSIAKLLAEWGLLTIVSNADAKIATTHITVIPHRDKSNWTLVTKYSIGKSK